MCDELSEMAEQCWSPTTGKAVYCLARGVRTICELLESWQTKPTQRITRPKTDK